MSAGGITNLSTSNETASIREENEKKITPLLRDGKTKTLFEGQSRNIPDPKKPCKEAIQKHSLLSRSCLFFEAGPFTVKTKSGSLYSCRSIELIKDEEFGSWLKLIGVSETNLWSQDRTVAVKNITIEISASSVETVART